jgi:hypothetical protein
MIVNLEQDSEGFAFNFNYDGVNHCGYEPMVMDKSMTKVLDERILDEIYSWLVLTKGTSEEEALTITNNINITYK